MSVAWIGNREAPLKRAVEHAASLLRSSRCPVFIFDADVHGSRAVVALAERAGAAYDHPQGAAVAAETALFTSKGLMTVAPGEARRRADLLIVVGAMPEAYGDFLEELVHSEPDLPERTTRRFFTVGKADANNTPWTAGAPRIALEDGGLAATLAALRAQCAGRSVAAPVSNFERFSEALAAARFPVFVFSGHSADPLALEMLQGLISDLNRKSRASGLHLAANENGWGATLASTWMTGFPLRTGFARGFPEFDPWRFDAARAIAEGEVDLLLRICAGPEHPPAKKKGTHMIALAKTSRPVAGASVTIAIGDAGHDHDAVIYSARMGGLVSVKASAASELPSAASLVHAIAEQVSVEAMLPC